MKKLLMALLGAYLLNFSSVQAATVFSPELNLVDNTFENADFFNFSMPANYQLGLFDFTDTGFTNALYINTGDSVSFSPSTPSAVDFFTASNDMTGSSINVTATVPAPGTPSFILAIVDTVTGVWYGDVGATALNSAGNAWNVSFQTVPGITTSVDVTLSAVPIPAAVWLFGTGMIGLIGIAKRRKAFA